MICKKVLNAIKTIKKNKILVFPTETVYGIGTCTKSLDSIKKIYEIKKRPKYKPLSIYVDTISKIKIWAINIPEFAIILAKKFLPGPITLILKKNPKINENITNSKFTIAIRIPNHSMTLKVLTHFDGIVGTSANKHNKQACTQIKTIHKNIKKQTDYILNGGICSLGIESTIIDCTKKYPIIIRQGLINKKDILKKTNIKIK